MPNYKIAVINHNELELIIVPMDVVFEYRPNEKKLEFRAELQGHAEDAGFIGSVCLVWPYAGGMKFLAPRPTHDFFVSHSVGSLRARINHELLW